MDDLESVIEQLKQELGEDKITTASDPKIKRPERALERQAIEDFMDRNPRADGGRIGFYRGEKVVKSHGKQIKDLTEAGESSVSIAKKLKLKQQTVNAAMDAMDKGIAGEKFKLSKPRKDIVKLAVNQYAPMRGLEEVQKAIDNAPPIEIDGKLFEQNKKDLRGDSEFSGKEVVTRKEQDKYGDKLKYKSAGKKRIVPVTQAYYDRRARELAKSNPTILKKLSGKGGYQLSHLSLSELDTLKNLGYLPAEINLKQYFPFEKKIVEISQEIYETQNNKKLSAQEKRDKIAELQRKDRALRKQFPEFAKTKARLNVRATGLDPSGLMIKEKLPDPSIAIAPTEAGTQLKGTKVGSEKGKAILEMGKNNLQKLAAIGCPGKMMGGRVGFSKGENLQACALKGVEKLKGDPGKLTGGDQANLRAISKSAKAARLLKNILGPAAIAGEVLIEGGIAANKFMSEGVPIKQALGQSYLNYLLGPKTKIDVEAERAKEFAKGEDFAMAERGRRMAPFMAQSAQADELRRIKAMKKMEQAFPTTSPQEIDEILKTQGVTIQDFGMTYPQIQDFIKQDQQMQAIADAGGVANLAGGGIAKEAGDSSGPPPESGPNSQGLPGLLKRVRNL